MENTNIYSTKGFLKTANDFLKYLVIDFKTYTKQAKQFFQKPVNQIGLGKNHDLKITANNLSKKENFNSFNKSKKNNNMSNLRNNVQLIGRLGKSPEVKQLESGRFVANVSIATNDIYKNAKGEKVIETQWHNLVAWGKNAENFQKILNKGDEVAIQGKLTHRSYEDKDGVTRYVTEIVVNEFVKLSNKNQLANVA
ncbi:MAG: single-stranded DNA-binding protein [Saprospiraceae bacterium]